MLGGVTPIDSALGADMEEHGAGVARGLHPRRAALVHVLGMPIDFLTRIEIGPGSLSIVDVNDAGPRVTLVNG